MGHSFSADDVAALLRAASSDCSGASLVDHVRGAFDEVAKVIPHHTLAAYFIARPGTLPVPLLTKELDQESLVDYVRHYRPFDPMAASFGLASSPVATLAACAAREGMPLRRSVYLNEFLVPRFGIQKILGTNIAVGSESMLTISVHRRRELPDFSEKELLAARLVIPRLSRAFSATLADEDAVQRLQPDGPSSAEVSGVAVLSSALELVQATAGARDAWRIIAEAGETGRLLALASRMVARFAEERDRTFVDTATVLRTATAAVAARIFVMATADADDVRVHILLDVLPSSFDVVMARLAAPYALTPRELEVLVLLHGGKTQVGIAEQLGVAATTIREHLVNIRRKVGAATNEQILPLMLGLSRGPLRS